MDPSQLLQYIIRPTLAEMGARFDTHGAAVLLLATAAQESHCGAYVHQIGGPALGYIQCEPATHSLVWDWALRNASGQLPAVRPRDERLMWDWRYATVIARLLYASWGITPVDDGPDDCWQAFEMWDRYKQRYNSALGAATKEQFTANWARYVAPVL